jgi:hypothetical protein
MGNSNSHTYNNKANWVVIDRKNNKEMLQSKINKKYVEKHHRNIVDIESMKKENWIYEWRGNKKNILNNV